MAGRTATTIIFPKSKPGLSVSSNAFINLSAVCSMLIIHSGTGTFALSDAIRLIPGIRTIIIITERIINSEDTLLNPRYDFKLSDANKPINKAGNINNPTV